MKYDDDDDDMRCLKANSLMSFGFVFCSIFVVVVVTYKFSTYVAAHFSFHIAHTHNL